MSEYIITDRQLKTATEAYLEHELSRPITEVFVSGDKLPEIVRCRDCKFFMDGCFTRDIDGNIIEEGNVCDFTGLWIEPNEFCAWGVRKSEGE